MNNRFIIDDCAPSFFSERYITNNRKKLIPKNQQLVVMVSEQLYKGNFIRVSNKKEGGHFKNKTRIGNNENKRNRTRFLIFKVLFFERQ